MGAKEELRDDLIRHDTSGGVERIHNLIIEFGLKYKCSANSYTLRYYFRHEGRDIEVAAMRRSIFSFPRTFWRPRIALVLSALSRVASYNVIPTEPAISSSQNSAGQIAINRETISEIEAILESVVIPEARRAGA